MKTFELSPGGLDGKPSLLEKIRSCREPVILNLEPRIYHIRLEHTERRGYHISNHTQQERDVFLPFEDLENLHIQGNGAELRCHGLILPLAFVKVKNVSVENLSIDYEYPLFYQFHVEAKEGDRTLCRPAPGTDLEIDRGRVRFEKDCEPACFCSYLENGQLIPGVKDIRFEYREVERTASGLLAFRDFSPAARVETWIAARPGERPAPGLFADRCRNFRIRNVTCYTAPGMGFLAQNSTDVELDHFRVMRRNDRFYSTRADATHFVNCNGRIDSHDGFYESMADDAINVHGIYLKVKCRSSVRTLSAQFMHEESWGLEWGVPGERVSFVDAMTMRPFHTAVLRDIAMESDEKTVRMEFDSIPELPEDTVLENLTRTPEVRFRGNTIRFNRARGALFTTPGKVICENNRFCCVQGAAILLNGDANYWYESGACRDVTIRNNVFDHCMSVCGQYCGGIISVWPVIRREEKDFHYHGRIHVCDNRFFGERGPLLYAKSASEVIFRHNFFNGRESESFQPTADQCRSECCLDTQG